MNTSGNHEMRERLLILTALAALLLGSFWSYGRLSRAHNRAVEDGDAWTRSRSLATQIQALRDEPTLADDHAMKKDDMTRRIAAAVAEASLDEKRLIAIEHQAARRIGRSAYLEEPTHLTFRDVTLRQIITTLYALTQDDARLQVSRLRLSAPRQETDAKRWTVDTTVAYLIYEPTTQHN